MSSSDLTAEHTAVSRPPWWRRLTRKHLLFAAVAVLLAAEQVTFLLGGGASGSRQAPARAAQAVPATLAGHIESRVAAALGPSDRGVRRFRLTALHADARQRGLYALNLTWAINGDLSLGSISAGAQLDVYLVMRALYTAALPISTVRLTGTFGDRDKHGRTVEVPVLIVGMDRAVARAVDWQNMDATEVWPLVHRYVERPGFECQCQE